MTATECINTLRGNEYANIFLFNDGTYDWNLDELADAIDDEDAGECVIMGGNICRLDADGCAVFPAFISRTDRLTNNACLEFSDGFESVMPEWYDYDADCASSTPWCAPWTWCRPEDFVKPGMTAWEMGRDWGRRILPDMKETMIIQIAEHEMREAD